MIFDLQKFCTKDGPGIRTTVFLKGCPLHCVWCHNPESQKAEREFMYDISCQSGKLCGYEISADEVIREALKDRLFYENSGGGLTVSGGEPLFQPKFCLELLQKAKKQNLHVCLETCGFAEQKIVGKAAGAVDLFLFDYKETDPAKHREFTGADNEQIIENLRFIDTRGKSIILRCPIIPGFNDRNDHFQGIARLADSLENLIEVEIEPYHTFGMEKYKRLKRSYGLADIRNPKKEDVDGWIAEIQKNTSARIQRA